MAETYEYFKNLSLEQITPSNALELADKLSRDPDFIDSIGPKITRAPVPTKLSVDYIKNKLLRPALTSHYQCWFNPPTAFRQWLQYKSMTYELIQELISLCCSEAVLPGSSMMTNEINDDYTGVTERHAYRRQFDDRADFTFYVNHDDGGNGYAIIKFFEYWLSYIAGEEYAEGLEGTNYFYRVRYPRQYQSPTIYVNKFEKDFGGKYLQYRLLQAYPISISSMPVSYESSQLLKCTVSFTYTRYLVDSLDMYIPPEYKVENLGGILGYTDQNGLFVGIPPIEQKLPNGSTRTVPTPMELSPADIATLNKIATRTTSK